MRKVFSYNVIVSVFQHSRATASSNAHLISDILCFALRLNISKPPPPPPPPPGQTAGYLSCEFYPPGSAASSLPSLPQPVKFPGGKVHTYTPANSISDGPITNLLSVLCSFDRSPFTRSCEWGKKALVI